jgi:hypothetical protein
LKPLERLARDFAADVTDLLNRTVTHGVSVSAVLFPPDRVLLAAGITKRRYKPKPIRLTIGARAPAAYLQFVATLEMDSAGTYLTVRKSTVAVWADQHGDLMLCHYDYELDPAHGYPDPHVQVAGTSPALEAIQKRRPVAATQLGELHFPVGGRRFRPTLEDVVEFLILEGIAESRPGWQAAVDEHRNKWREKQLKAAVRRYREWAAEALMDLGYEVAPPPDAEPPPTR